MTVVIGYSDKNGVVIGADSQISDENGTILTSLTPKVFEKNNVLFGTCNSIRVTQVIRYKFEIPERNGKGLFEYLCTDFIDALAETLCNNNCTYMKNGSMSGSEIIIGIDGQLFAIDDDFHIIKTSLPFFAIGSGKQFAFGSMLSLEMFPQLPPKARIELTLQSVSKLCSSVGAPFHFVEKFETD